MARSLNEAERQIIASALSAYAQQLDGASSTGVPAVDAVVAEQADISTALSVAFSEATRGSISLPDTE